MSCATHGLFHGNTGLCIFYYCLFRETQDSAFEEFAEKLLDKIFEGLSTTESTDFEWGLAGIGWGIEYLIQNHFVEGNADEILEEIDHRIFKTLNEDKFDSFDLTNGLTGYLFYLIRRLKNPADLNLMPYQINRELLILIINRLDEIMTPQFAGITKDMIFDLCWRYPLMLCGLINAYNLNIYNNKIKNALAQWVLNFETFLPSLHINRIWMATELHRINAILCNHKLERQIKTLFFSVDLDELKTEIDYDALNFRHGWFGMSWVLSHALSTLPATVPNYELIRLFNEELISRLKPAYIQMIEAGNTAILGQPGLSDGLSGICLASILESELHFV